MTQAIARRLAGLRKLYEPWTLVSIGNGIPQGMAQLCCFSGCELHTSTGSCSVCAHGGEIRNLARKPTPRRVRHQGMSCHQSAKQQLSVHEAAALVDLAIHFNTIQYAQYILHQCDTSAIQVLFNNSRHLGVNETTRHSMYPLPLWQSSSTCPADTAHSSSKPHNKGLLQNPHPQP